MIVIGRWPPIEFRVPAIDDETALVEIADRGLPLVTLLQVSAFDDAAAGKTQEPGLHVFQQLHEIGAQAIRPVLPRVFWKKRHEIDIDTAIAFEQKIKMALAARVVGPQGGGIRLPRIRQNYVLCFTDDAVADVIIPSRQGETSPTRPPVTEAA